MESEEASADVKAAGNRRGHDPVPCTQTHTTSQRASGSQAQKKHYKTEVIYNIIKINDRTEAG